mmetsp:Transcript_18030/g.54315  ORF Transcript_18030/g.54315 Transcript_18030/m.54315 type:complete len:126 (+) Transcript_18030:673-1050(+)
MVTWRRTVEWRVETSDVCWSDWRGGERGATRHEVATPSHAHAKDIPPIPGGVYSMNVAAHRCGCIVGITAEGARFSGGLIMSSATLISLFCPHVEQPSLCAHPSLNKDRDRRCEASPTLRRYVLV